MGIGIQRSLIPMIDNHIKKLYYYLSRDPLCGGGFFSIKLYNNNSKEFVVNLLFMMLNYKYINTSFLSKKDNSFL